MSGFDGSCELDSPLPREVLVHQRSVTMSSADSLVYPIRTTITDHLKTLPLPHITSAPSTANAHEVYDAPEDPAAGLSPIAEAHDAIHDPQATDQRHLASPSLDDPDADLDTASLNIASNDTNAEYLIPRHLHPGYIIETAPEALLQPLETYTPGHPSYATHIAIREDFARSMRESRVCVFDSSLERKMIRKVGAITSLIPSCQVILNDGEKCTDPCGRRTSRLEQEADILKYAQAMLSGCVIAADLPTEHESALRSFIIPLQPSWGIKQIEAQIRAYLARPDEMHRMAMEGFVYARSHLTTT